MKDKSSLPRIETGVRNMDALLNGGIPKGSAVVIGGPPGSGKTILVQQICFHNATADRRVLYFNTLSEPTAKTLRYAGQFDFFDAEKVDSVIEYVDLGVMVRSTGLEETSNLIMQRVRQSKPAIVVIDSFKVFNDLASSQEELRKFGYELAVNLMAWEATTFLLGEFGPNDIEDNPLFSIIDGLIAVMQREQSGEQQRLLQVVKMRGTDHSRDRHPFVIKQQGIEVFAPRVTIQRTATRGELRRMETGITRLDELLGEGIPHGSSLLVSGVAGTGKTVLLLEFIYRGARAGQKGILFSFEETGERLRAAARGLGLELDAEIERGMVEIVFIPQPNIMVEGDLLMMRERIEALQAQRVAVDSLSVFLHKVKDPLVGREKTFQLATIIQSADAVGLLATDIPYGAQQVSRFGVEETVVDGVIVLSATEEGLERRRYLEVYKLRNTAHLKGRHSMEIARGGVTIFPRYHAVEGPPLPVNTARRLPSGVPGLDALIGGGLLERSVTLLSGSAGIGKSTMGLQFLIEGCQRGEPGLYIALEEGPAQIIEAAEAFGLPLRQAVADGLAEVAFLPRDRVLPSQLLSILGDKIQKQNARRVVFDSVTHLASEGLSADELRQLLYALMTRFKALGATVVLTLESSNMYSSEQVTDRRFSPVADNLIALRYARLPGEIRPTIMVVKTRGSAHDYGTYFYTVERGGARIGPRATTIPGVARRHTRESQPSKPRKRQDR